MTTSVSYFLGILTIAAQILIVVLAGSFLFFKKDLADLAKKIAPIFFLGGVFAVSLVATLGSLFYSQVAGFVPCELCWYQRIFMYPQAILSGLALMKKDENIAEYSLALASIGTLISLYHNYLVYGGASSGVCSLSAASCAVKVITSFGYITIPLMALTAFVLLILLLLVSKLAKNR